MNNISNQLSLQQLRVATADMRDELSPHDQATLAHFPEQPALMCMLDSALALCQVTPGGQQSRRMVLWDWALKVRDHSTVRLLGLPAGNTAFLQLNPGMLQVLSRAVSCVFAGWADSALVGVELHRDNQVYVRVSVDPRAVAAGQVPLLRADFRDTRRHLTPPHFVLTEHARRSSGAVAAPGGGAVAAPAPGGGAVGGRWSTR